jgi:hypothetical protein
MDDLAVTLRRPVEDSRLLLDYVAKDYFSDDGRYADLTVRLDGNESVSCHRIVFASVSDVVKRALIDAAADDDDVVLIVPGVDAGDMRSFLDEVYGRLLLSSNADSELFSADIEFLSALGAVDPTDADWLNSGKIKPKRVVSRPPPVKRRKTAKLRDDVKTATVAKEDEDEDADFDPSEFIGRVHDSSDQDEVEHETTTPRFKNYSLKRKKPKSKTKLQTRMAKKMQDDDTDNEAASDDYDRVKYEVPRQAEPRRFLLECTEPLEGIRVLQQENGSHVTLEERNDKVVRSRLRKQERIYHILVKNESNDTNIIYVTNPLIR